MSLQYITSRVIENQLDLVYKNKTVMDISDTISKSFPPAILHTGKEHFRKRNSSFQGYKKLTLDKWKIMDLPNPFIITQKMSSIDINNDP